MNIKGLLITLGVLIAILIVVMISDSKTEDRSFKKDLISLEVDQVNEIQIYPRGAATGSFVTLNKAEDTWKVSGEKGTFRADQNQVPNMIRQLNEITAERVAANKKDQWAKYEVNDSLSTRVVAKGEKGELVDIYIGKFSYQQPANTGAYNPYQQQQGKMTTYVRLSKEKEVYAVNGFLSASFNKDVDQLRDRTVISGNSGNWTKVSVNHPGDSSFVMEKNGNEWRINNMACDSASVVEYIRNLGSLRGSAYVQGLSQGEVMHEMIIEGNGLSAPIHITASMSNGTQAIESSLNKGNVFDGAQGQLFDKLFRKRPTLK